MQRDLEPRLIQERTFGQFGLQKLRYRDAVVSGQLSQIVAFSRHGKLGRVNPSGHLLV